MSPPRSRVLRDRRAEHAAQREHEGGERVGILADEGEPAGAVRMGRDQPQLEPREVAQEQAPYRMPPQPAQQEEQEQGVADQHAPPAGGREPRALGPHGHEPGRCFGSLDDHSADHGDRIGQDHTSQLGEPQIAPPQGPHHRLGRGRLRAGGDQRRPRELAKMASQPLLDHALHQHEDADRDEEARPGAEVEEERAAREWADRMARNGAQHERHAPGEPDQDRRAPTGVERPLVQQPEPLLQLVERPAVRDQELVDARRPGVCFGGETPRSRQLSPSSHFSKAEQRRAHAANATTRSMVQYIATAPMP